MKREALGLTIRSFREKNHMTQADLAARLGVTDKAVSKWERGISYPDVSLFPKLADIIGVTADDLLKDFAKEGHPSRLLQIFERSHDVRPPLHIILGCVDMVEKYQDDEALLQRYLESIRVSGEYLLHMIDQVMRLASQEPENEPVQKNAAYPNAADIKLYRRVTQEKADLRKYDFSGRRILVAEDMELNREIAEELLKQTGAEVDFAEDGKFCVEKIMHAPEGYYDLILMDISMPNMDGIQATKRIRELQDKRKANIPIIAMTAKVYEKDRKQAYEAGMNGFAEKPVFAKELYEIMKECM